MISRLKLDELKNKCNLLGLSPEPTKKRLNPERYELSVDDCVQAIKEYHLNRLHKEGIYSEALDLMLCIGDFMLATNITQIKKDSIREDIKRDIWDTTNPDWIFQEKINGERVMLIYSAIDKEFSLYTRELNEYCIPALHIDVSYKKDVQYWQLENISSFMLDCELVREDVVKLYAFDCVYNNVSIVDEPLSKRRLYTRLFANLLKNCGMNIELVPEATLDYKENFYNELKHNYKEGVIAKDLNSTYSVGKRTTNWIKLKNDPFDTTTQTNSLYVRLSSVEFLPLQNEHVAIFEIDIIDSYTNNNVIQGTGIGAHYNYITNTNQTKSICSTILPSHLLQDARPGVSVAEINFESINLNEMILVKPEFKSWINCSPETARYSKSTLLELGGVVVDYNTLDYARNDLIGVQNLIYTNNNDLY